MEQSYSDIDGDSASLAEACALFSSLAGAPIRQDIAMTGSVDQRGVAQAVGGVNEKIEGFFRVCQQRDPNGAYEVIIPASNTKDLMLDEDVVEACRAGRFKVHTIETIEDALELLTGRSWEKGKNAIGPVVLAQLEALAAVQALANATPRASTKVPRALPKAAKPRRR